MSTNKLLIEKPVKTFADILEIDRKVYLFSGIAPKVMYLKDGLLICEFGRSSKQVREFPIENLVEAEKFYNALYNIQELYLNKEALKTFILKEMEIDVAYQTGDDKFSYIKVDQLGSGYSYLVSRGSGVFDSYRPIRGHYVRTYKNILEAKKR